MLETVKYLIGSVGASGYGSKSTSEQVTESCGDLRSITAIITGKANYLTATKSCCELESLTWLFVIGQALRRGSELRQLGF